MGLCTQNLTIGMYDIRGSRILELENNRFKGLIGNHLDKYFTHKKERNCSFRPAFFFNDQLDQNIESVQNISAFHLLRKGELDFHAVPQEYGIYQENANLEMSQIIMLVHYEVGQLIDKPNKLDNSDFLSFFINNTSILITLLIGYSLTKLFIYFYFKLIKSEFKFLNLFSMNLRARPNLSKVSLIILFFNIFLFINLSLFSNSIKTDKVIVKTDRLIDSLDKLNRTSKILTFHEDESRIFTQAPQSSFLYQFYKKKSKKKEIYKISTEIYTEQLSFLDSLVRHHITNFIFLMSKTKILGTLRFLISYASNYSLWIKSTLFHERMNCYYINRNLIEKKKRILHFRINGAFENGLFSHLIQRIDDDLKLSILKDLKIFESLKEFINEYSSSSSDVHFDNYRTLFITYLGILILIFIVFNFHHGYKFIERKFLRSEPFHSFTEDRLRKSKKITNKYQKCIKTNRPIYRTNAVVLMK